MKLFAYGSNMKTSRLEERVGKVECKGIATLKNFDIRFHKPSKDGSTKADAHFAGAGHSLVGVLYELTVEQFKMLDSFEAGYTRKVVEVDTDWDGGISVAHTYVANKIVEGEPYEWYVNLIREGMKEHGISEDCINKLNEIKTKC